MLGRILSMLSTIKMLGNALFQGAVRLGLTFMFRL